MASLPYMAIELSIKLNKHTHRLIDIVYIAGVTLYEEENGALRSLKRTGLLSVSLLCRVNTGNFCNRIQVLFK